MQRVLFTTLLAATVLPACKRPPAVQEDPDGQAAIEAWARTASEAAAPAASVVPETSSPPKSPETTLDEHRKAMATAANDGDYAAVCKGTPWVQPTLCLWVAARAAGKPVERPDGEIFRAYFGKEHWSHAYGRIVGKAGENGDYEVSVGGYRHHCVLDVIDTNFENEGTFNLWVQEQPTTREVTLNSGDTEQWVVLEEAVLAKDLMDLAHSGSGLESTALAKNAMNVIALYVPYAERKGQPPSVPSATSSTAIVAAASAPATVSVMSLPTAHVATEPPKSNPASEQRGRSHAACLQRCVATCNDDPTCERACAAKCP